MKGHGDRRAGAHHVTHRLPGGLPWGWAVDDHLSGLAEPHSCLLMRSRAGGGLLDDALESADVVVQCL
jgi:hypothetical protein